MTAAAEDRLISRHRPHGAPAPLPMTARDLTPDTEHTGQVEPLGAGWMTVTVIIGVMAALIALGGMVLSFRAVSTEMIPAFGARWAWLVPIVVDLTVFVFSGVDLVLARLDMSHPLARWTVYGATGGTVWLNYSVGGSPAGRVAHVLMPAIWVVFVELMRHVVRRQANLATGSHREPIPAARWLLSPWPTLKLWRRMVLWRVHSYPRALEQEKMRLGAVAAARQLHGRLWRLRISPLTRLQINLGELGAHDLHPQAARPTPPVATAAPSDPAAGQPPASGEPPQLRAAAHPTVNGHTNGFGGVPPTPVSDAGTSPVPQHASVQAPALPDGLEHEAAASGHETVPAATLPGVAAAGAAAGAAAREAAARHAAAPAVSATAPPPSVPAQRAHAAPPAVPYPQADRSDDPAHAAAPHQETVRQEAPHVAFQAPPPMPPLPRRSTRESELLTAAREVERWRGQPSASRISRELGIGMALATSLANALRDENGPALDE